MTKSGYKSVKTIFQHTEEIPNDWNFKKISQLGKIVGGGTPDTKNEKFWKDGDISWFTPEEITNLKSNFVKHSERKITDLGIKESSAKKLPKNALLITTRATIGNCAICEDEVSTNQGFQNIICNKTIDHKFLLYSIKHNKRRLRQYAQGTTFLEINKTNLSKIRLPCPEDPLESKKIGQYLLGVDILIENQYQKIEFYQELKQGLMRTFFSKGVNGDKSEIKTLSPRYFKQLIPKSWELGPLGKFAKLKPGYAFKSHDYVEEGIRSLTISNVSHGEIIWDEETFLPEEFWSKYSEYQLKNQDLIMAMTRPVISTGIKISFFNFDKKTLLNQRVGKFAINSELDKKYLFYFINSNYFIKQVNVRAPTNLQPNISSEEVEKIPIWMPVDEKEKEKIVDVLENCDVHIENLIEQYNYMKNIKKGMMQQLLTGQKKVKI